MSGARTILVCLPRHIPPEQWTELAAAQLVDHGLRMRGPVAHFHTGVRSRRRSRRLLDHRNGTAAGGPVGLLDLAGMRQHAQALAAYRWQVWSDVVAATRPARPYWVFADRHAADPVRYPLTQARSQYTSQPRLLAMAAYNALPYRPVDLPDSEIEAFQAGPAGYAHLAWLAAVPADGMTTSAGSHSWLLLGGRRELASQLAYLRVANAHLAGLPASTTLLAVTAA